MQNGQDLQQLSLCPLQKFGTKVQKIFELNLFGPEQILFIFVLFMNEIFSSEVILQLPNKKPYVTSH